jgi:7-cyano-7-deazaguanine synthase
VRSIAVAEAHAVVLLSGGLDSATALAIACEQCFACHALSVDYGQRHAAELDAARRAVPESPSEGIPVTYVPARNTIMLALALAWAEVLGARDIFIGVNVLDSSGYPDCRPEFIAAFGRVAELATRAGVEGRPCRIHTPLIGWTKAEIIREGTRLKVDYRQTVSCYQADAEGRACGRCDACRLRRAGFLAAGLPDPTWYQGV